MPESEKDNRIKLSRAVVVEGKYDKIKLSALVDGVIIVTTPQDLVGMIVTKAVKMAEMMHVPVLGVVENMSYYTCPDCGKQHEIFGASKVKDVAAAFGIPHTARIPVDPTFTAMVDAGEIEKVDAHFIQELTDCLEEDLPLGK